MAQGGLYWYDGAHVRRFQSRLQVYNSNNRGPIRHIHALSIFIAAHLCAVSHSRARARVYHFYGGPLGPSIADFHSTKLPTPFNGTFTAHAQRRVGLLRMPSTKSTCSWMLVWTTRERRRARRRGICGVVRAFFSREERNRRERISWISPMSLKK